MSDIVILGMQLQDFLMLLTPFGAVLALCFVVIQFTRLKGFPEGTDLMKSISSKIRRGANAFMKRQYTTIAIFFVVMIIILCIMASNGLLTWFVPFAFLTGGLFSGFAGVIGMRAATMANCRTAAAAQEGLNKGLRVAFSAGSIMGFVVVGLGLLDLAAWYYILKYGFDADPTTITQTMLTFGMGSSSVALFARVGGGIFTKAADVGADLVGKVEAGIPEDDPRNPAVIADNVGDNVGDVAGMGADLYESYVGSIVAASALGVAASAGIEGVSGDAAITIPMAMGGLGVIASIFGTFLVRTKEGASQKNLLTALRQGTYFSAVLIAIAAFPLVWFMLGRNHIGLYGAILSGLVAGIGISFFTEYYTSDHYGPTKRLSATSETGTATLMIGGLSLGMLSTAAPTLIICVSLLVSFFISGGTIADPGIGLYAIGLSAVGMLSTLGITLASDAYGPVADNAGGIAEMAKMPKEVRERTDALDSLGNTTAATGKGFCIAAGALTALALVASYIERVDHIKGDIGGKAAGFTWDLALNNPLVLVGLFLGCMMTFFFTSNLMNSVGRAAQGIVKEVRRQFKEIKGLIDGKEGVEADYETCVDICTKSALREMVFPALLAIFAPILIGIIIGPNGVIGYLMGATASGLMMAVFTANSGGAWDNAKKHIESGNFGGKGSDNHKAAVVGDTVGDPFKDTCGPAVDILLKLSSMVSIVFAGLVLQYHILG